MKRWSILVVLLAFFSLPPEALAEETEHPVSPGDRLDISNYAGAIHVNGWSRDVIRIVAEKRPGDALYVSRLGSVLRVRTGSWERASDSLAIEDGERAVLRLDGKEGLPGVVTYWVSVPRWLPVTAGGARTDVVIEGVHAAVDITLIEGEIRVQGGRGDLSVRSLGGTLSVADQEGTLKYRGWQGGAHFQRTQGNLIAQTTSGKVTVVSHLRGSVEVVTVAGDLGFQGPLPRDAGVYLATHSGEIDVHLSEDASAAVTVRNHRGRFESDFPADDAGKKRFRFRIGSGRTPLELESFSGTIRIGRTPGSPDGAS